MLRKSLVLVFAAALLAGCGSSSHSSAPLSPAAYRSTMAAMCAKEKSSLGAMTSNPTSSPAEARKRIPKVLDALSSMISALQGVTPPSSLASAHSQLIGGLKTAQSAIQSLQSIKPGDTTAGFAAFGSIMSARTEMQTSLKTLRLPSCASLLLSNG